MALGSGVAGAILARSITTWLRQSRTDPTLKVKNRAGTEVSFDVRHAKDPETMLRVVTKLLNDANNMHPQQHEQISGSEEQPPD